ncbi:type I-B CRISPR-associated protein Cas5 [Thermococcus sp. GR5]|uniref:type I-B CRISPR-associated protein Cas5b n=1 Tax=unclassified Thermococcus TaxID=2627626 RepID=UPI0014301446|nr:MULTISPECIES: type I-B CRISPR-associated protein Cas5b [unclassified Thermococcus]NJF23816.1 type I-B CRISPR-associated protein Cas5 [Thermococcus sp. GR5]
MAMAEKTLFIELFQPFAQYRNPFTFYYAQTYPLPPKSTIIGMLQNALNDWYGLEHGLETWWDLKVSVHGGFESVFWNYQQLIKATKTGISLVRFRGKPTLWNQNLPLYGFSITSQRSPVLQQELFNGWIYLLLKGEESLLNEIKEALKQPRKVLSLGRSEDVVFIRNVKFVEGKEKRAREVAFKIPTYVATPIEHLQKKEYPTYSIPIKVVFKNGDRPVKHKAEINTNTFRDVEFKSVIYVGAWTFLKFKEKVKLEEYSIEGKTLKVVTDGSASGWL